MILKGKVWALNSDIPGILVLLLVTCVIKDKVINLMRINNVCLTSLLCDLTVNKKGLSQCLTIWVYSVLKQLLSDIYLHKFVGNFCM